MLLAKYGGLAMKNSTKSSESSKEKSGATATRRRGIALEEAILNAALDELAEVNFTELTMESIAARAGTNKAVLYRRWANKTELIFAVMRKYQPKPLDQIPDTGDLRNDLLSYILGMTQPIQQIGTQAIKGLIKAQLGNAVLTSIPQMLPPRGSDKITKAMTSMLQNAAARGEIKMEKLSPRVISLPMDLLRFELITRQEMIPDEVIIEIVDEIFLPLVYALSKAED